MTKKVLAIALRLPALTTAAAATYYFCAVRAPPRPAEQPRETAGEKDALIIDDARKYAFFGWYKASNMPFQAWAIFGRTVEWAISPIEPGRAKVLLIYRPSGDRSVWHDPDALAVHNWLSVQGYKVYVLPCDETGKKGPNYYAQYDLVLYWTREKGDVRNILAAGVPFITVRAAHTSDMGIGTGVETSLRPRRIFYVVNNVHPPTSFLPLDRLEMGFETWASTTEASGDGLVLVKAEVESAYPRLRMLVEEQVSVQENGSATISMVIKVPESPLAEQLREAFGIPTTVPPGHEMPIPEWATSKEVLEVPKGVTLEGMNETETRLPVRELFHQGIIMEHQVVLNISVQVLSSSIIPFSKENATEIKVLALAAQLARPVYGTNGWRIELGPRDENGTLTLVDFMATRLSLLQLMLRAWPGEQVFEYRSYFNVTLPPESELADPDGLEKHGWFVYLGGGSKVEAYVRASRSSFCIEEEWFVTEYELELSPSNITQAFYSYKKLDASYVIKKVAVVVPPGTARPLSARPEGWHDFDYHFSKTWSYTLRKTWTFGSSATITIRAIPSLTLSGYVGWRFHWAWFHSYLEWFKAWMRIQPSFRVEVNLDATMDIYRSRSCQLLSTSVSFSFWIGIIYVWAYLKLNVWAGVEFHAHGEIHVNAWGQLTGWLKAGVKWQRGQGWRKIWDRGVSASRDISISGEASLSIHPYAKGRLSFLFYNVAGPFVELKPYISIYISCEISGEFEALGRWDIYFRLKIVAGATFAGWLKSLLDLSDYSRTLADWTLAHWSGTWG
ncbi:hypothetical protein DRO33_03600 [Candidatus Bathyarchaeota archaeon]|nr:MAG: hypothetical protein DRO33_03600 [Candidatus Bathyarchaeota archaeon]